MCNLLDLNDDCLLEIASKLYDIKDRLSFFVVINRFNKIIVKDLKNGSCLGLYRYLRNLDSKMSRNDVELTCSFVTELNIDVVDSDTLDYFSKYGKCFTNLEALTLYTRDISIDSEKYLELEQVFMPVFGRLKKLTWIGNTRRTNLIDHTKNLERGFFYGKDFFDDKTFTIFLKNNQKTLRSLIYSDDISLQIFNEETLRTLSRMKCLKLIKLYVDRIDKSDDYVNFMNAIAIGNTVEHLKLYVRERSDNPSNWPFDFGPAIEMTSLKTLSLSCHFREMLENFSLINLPNLKSLTSTDTISKEQIFQLLKDLPLLECIDFDYKLRREDMLEIESYLAEKNRQFTIRGGYSEQELKLKFLNVRKNPTRIELDCVLT